MQKERKPNGYWNIYDNCYEAAKQCTSRSELEKKFYRAFYTAKKNGWLDDYDWFKPKQKPSGYWNNYQHCYDAAKECKSVSGFIKQYHRAYYIARKNNWLQDYTWLYNK